MVEAHDVGAAPSSESNVTRAFFAVPILMLVGSLEPVAMSPRPAAEPVPVVEATTLPPVGPSYRAAAVAVRAHDFPGALQALAKDTQRDDSAGRHARIVAGLYAHALELPESAERLLGEEPAKGGAA